VLCGGRREEGREGEEDRAYLTRREVKERYALQRAGSEIYDFLGWTLRNVKGPLIFEPGWSSLAIGDEIATSDDEMRVRRIRSARTASGIADQSLFYSENRIHPHAAVVSFDFKPK